MKTLRSRFFVSFALAAVVSTLLTVLVAGFLARRIVERQILSGLQRQAQVAAASSGDPAAVQRLAASLRAEGVFVVPPGSLSQHPFLQQLVESGSTSGSTDVLGRKVFYAVAQTAQGPVVLARPAASRSTQWRPFIVVLVLAGLCGVAVGAILASYFAARISKPLGELAEATRQVAGGADARVPVDGSDEIAAVSSSFNSMAEQLAGARTAERTFLMSVSHELKTPLTAIRGYAEALRDGASSPDEAGGVIERESERLQRLLQDLLDLARLDQRQFAVTREPVDLAAVAREIEERYRPRAQEFGVALVVDAPAESVVAADRGRVMQVASNLVENALRATPRGGRVTVRASSGSIRVEDTGPGLTPDDVAHAFDRFFLYRRFGADRPVGSGLGLAIVKELTEAMGGGVAVTSEPGEGAAFEIRLAPV